MSSSMIESNSTDGRANLSSREEMMLNRLAESLRSENEVDVDMLAETLLLDADDEVYVAHQTPFFSGSGKHHQLHVIPPDEDDDSLAQQLQLQMEQASVCQSVDSRDYEYRSSNTLKPNGSTASANSSTSGKVSPFLMNDEAYNLHLQQTATRLSLLQHAEEEMSLVSATPDPSVHFNYDSFSSCRRGKEEELSLTEDMTDFSLTEHDFPNKGIIQPATVSRSDSISVMSNASGSWDDSMRSTSSRSSRRRRSQKSISFSPYIVVMGASQPVPCVSDNEEEEEASEAADNNKEEQQNDMEDAGWHGSGLGLEDALQPFGFPGDIHEKDVPDDEEESSQAADTTAASMTEEHELPAALVESVPESSIVECMEEASSNHSGSDLDVSFLGDINETFVPELKEESSEADDATSAAMKKQELPTLPVPKDELTRRSDNMNTATTKDSISDAIFPSEDDHLQPFGCLANVVDDSDSDSDSDVDSFIGDIIEPFSNDNIGLDNSIRSTASPRRKRTQTSITFSPFIVVLEAPAFPDSDSEDEDDGLEEAENKQESSSQQPLEEAGNHSGLELEEALQPIGSPGDFNETFVPEEDEESAEPADASLVEQEVPALPVASGESNSITTTTTDNVDAAIASDLNQEEEPVSSAVLDVDDCPGFTASSIKRRAQRSITFSPFIEVLDAPSALNCDSENKEEMPEDVESKQESSREDRAEEASGLGLEDALEPTGSLGDINGTFILTNSTPEEEEELAEISIPSSTNQELPTLPLSHEEPNSGSNTKTADGEHAVSVLAPAQDEQPSNTATSGLDDSIRSTASSRRRKAQTSINFSPLIVVLEAPSDSEDEDDVASNGQMEDTRDSIGETLPVEMDGTNTTPDLEGRQPSSEGGIEEHWEDEEEILRKETEDVDLFVASEPASMATSEPDSVVPLSAEEMQMREEEERMREEEKRRKEEEMRRKRAAYQAYLNHLQGYLNDILLDKHPGKLSFSDVDSEEESVEEYDDEDEPLMEKGAHQPQVQDQVVCNKKCDTKETTDNCSTMPTKGAASRKKSRLRFRKLSKLSCLPRLVLIRRRKRQSL